MNKILVFVKQEWFSRFLGIIAASILIWFIGPLIAIANYIPLAEATC